VTDTGHLVARHSLSAPDPAPNASNCKRDYTPINRNLFYITSSNTTVSTYVDFEVLQGVSHMPEHQFVEQSAVPISTTTTSGMRSVTAVHAILWGGLVAGILDAVDGVIAFGTQGLNPIQVLQYIASGALAQSAFRGGIATAALGATFHFIIAWVAAGVFVLATRRLEIFKTHAVPAGLLYGVAVYFFMNYLVLPLSAVAPSPFHIGLFLNGVIGHALLVGLPIALYSRRIG